MQIMKSTEIIIYTRNYLLYNDFISLSWYLFILLLVYALTYKEISDRLYLLWTNSARWRRVTSYLR